MSFTCISEYRTLRDNANAVDVFLQVVFKLAFFITNTTLFFIVGNFLLNEFTKYLYQKFCIYTTYMY